MTTIDQLEPCPFDGAPAELRHDNAEWGYRPGRYFVVCSECGASSGKYDDERWESGKGTYSIRDEAKRMAVDWWNRRAVRHVEITR
ncbi:MAG: Lar family restriction alleviation protein [Candidatus Eisenbacteria bacterium]